MCVFTCWYQNLKLDTNLLYRWNVNIQKNRGKNRNKAHVHPYAKIQIYRYTTTHNQARTPTQSNVYNVVLQSNVYNVALQSNVYNVELQVLHTCTPYRMSYVCCLVCVFCSRMPYMYWQHVLCVYFVRVCLTHTCLIRAETQRYAILRKDLHFRVYVLGISGWGLRALRVLGSGFS